MITIVPIASVSPSDVEHLLDLAFGINRHQRTAYKLREGTGAIADLSFAAVDDGALVGSIQCWPVELKTGSGDAVPLILVGPVAVHPDHQRGGIGHRLMAAALTRADETAREPMTLIGDASYYDRFFGFSARHTGEWAVPGPVDRDRLLARLRPGHVVPERAALGPRLIGALVRERD